MKNEKEIRNDSVREWECVNSYFFIYFIDFKGRVVGFYFILLI